MEHYFPGKRRRFGLFFISKMSHNHIWLTSFAIFSSIVAADIYNTDLPS